MLACENYPSLKDRQITKIQTEFPAWLGKLSDNQVEGMSFVLKPEFGGGIIALRNLDDPAKYASAEFAAVAIDELTKNTEDVFSQLRSIIRWPRLDDTKFLAATNPGSIGHMWVKRYWIDRDFPAYEPEPEKFHFVQAFAKDNPHLSQSYILSLSGLPETLRRAYLDGSWDLYEGQFFEEWRESIHVIEPFVIPSSWRRFRCIDHGRQAPTAAYWGAVDYDGRIYFYREHYARGIDADVNATTIRSLSEGDPPYWFTVLDSACFTKTGVGESIAEIYERNGVPCTAAPKDRKAGWALFHEYLRPRYGEATPYMLFFKECRNAVRTIPSLVHDDPDIEDVDTAGEDHAADAISYALQYLHEGRSAKHTDDPVQMMFERQRRRSQVTPHRLKDFYAGGSKPRR